MNLDELPEWCSSAVKEVGVPDLLSLPSSTLQQECRLAAGEVRQTRHLLLTEARRALTPVTALSLLECESQDAALSPLSLGCPELDALLSGGVPRRGVTELAGESGSGKTQLCLQLALEAASATEQAVVYICTEDAFPTRRLEQMRAERRIDSTITDRILIEHVPDVESLQVCCERRLMQLAGRRPLCAVIVDSVAAQFRCQYEAGEGARRARDIQKLGSALRRLSRQHRLAVLCVNQVTSVVPRDGAENTGRTVGPSVTPALGLAWATQLTTRLITARTGFSRADSEPRGRLMQLSVVSAPHLPPDTAYFRIEAAGVQGVAVTEDTPLVPLTD